MDVPFDVRTEPKYQINFDKGNVRLRLDIKISVPQPYKGSETK